MRLRSSLPRVQLLPAVVLAAVALAGALIALPASAAELGPLPAPFAQALGQIQHDPPPKELAANAHFVISDERAHHVYYKSLKDLGGVLLGVGTDPNYLFAGWMKAELVLLVDFDQVVADLHALYVVDLKNAADAEQFLAFWSPKVAKDSEALIEKSAPDGATAKRWRTAFRLGRSGIYDKWLTLRKNYKKLGVPNLLSEPDQYQHVRNLAQTGRIWAWRGDLTADKTMAGINAALRAQGKELMVFYITNAEAYFDYTPQARKNLHDLPYAEKSVLLRTQGRPDKPDQTADGHYSYYVQNGRDFALWLERKTVRSAKPICWPRKPAGEQGFFTLPGPPPPKSTQPSKPSKPSTATKKGT